MLAMQHEMRQPQNQRPSRLSRLALHMAASQREVLACGRTVVLTSHSMEECEALATRAGIMAAGARVGSGAIECAGDGEHAHAQVAYAQVLTRPRQCGMHSMA